MRKGLIRIRREYNTNRKNLFILFGGIFTVSLILSLVLDIFCSFTSVWNFIRSLILIPLSVSIFVLGYSASLYLHNNRMMEDPEWVPYRSRYSPKWRRYISMIIGSFLLVFMYANGYHVGYTLTASLFVAIIIALFAFMRLTRNEMLLEELEIPDARDIRYNKHKETLEKQRKLEEANKQSRIQKVLGVENGRRADEYDDDDYDEQ